MYFINIRLRCGFGPDKMAEERLSNSNSIFHPRRTSCACICNSWNCILTGWFTITYFISILCLKCNVIYNRPFILYLAFNFSNYATLIRIVYFFIAFYKLYKRFFVDHLQLYGIIASTLLFYHIRAPKGPQAFKAYRYERAKM